MNDELDFVLERIVDISPELIFKAWTDCLDSDFRPRENGFFTAKLELIPEGSGTRYRATALHKDEQTRQKHAEMGFETGWGIVLDQMLAYIKSNY